MSYPVTYDQAWDISRAIFRWNGCEAIEEHRSEGYMLTSTGLSAMSWGTLMGAWLKPAGDGTEVTVVTKRKFKADLVNELSEDSFHTSFAEAMKIVKAGKKLPFRPPVDMSTQTRPLNCNNDSADSLYEKHRYRHQDSYERLRVGSKYSGTHSAIHSVS